MKFLKIFSKPKKEWSPQKNYKDLIWYRHPEEISSISKRLPVKKGPATPLSYYPSYEGMTPQQRYKYKNWLNNGIEAPIEIGYVFLFYYGLERHIVEGELHKAVLTIGHLKQYHDNESFNDYSNNAIIVATLLSQNKNYLSFIDEESLRDDMYSNIRYTFYKFLTPADIIRIQKGVNFKNNRYIKSEYDLFLGNVKRVLANDYKSEVYHFRENIKANQQSFKSTLMLANYSLNDNQRILSVPYILNDKQTAQDLYHILFDAHELTKKELKLKRKAARKKRLE